MKWQNLLPMVGASCLLMLVISEGPSTSGDDQVSDVTTSVQGEQVSGSGIEAQKLEQIQHHRNEYQKLTYQVASRLRRFQGIPELPLLQSPGDHSPPDIRLAGARVNGLRGEFDTPKAVSLAEEEWIRLAGEIHASECSNLLLNRIADPREKVPVNARSLVPSDFTLGALCQIGQPACREALKRIPVEADKRRREKMVRLLQVVLGDSRAKTDLVRIQEAASDETQKRRVALAISQIDADTIETR